MTEKNLENVSHEEAVSALKCTSDRVILIVSKAEGGPLAPMLQSSLPTLHQQQQQQPLLSQSAANLTTTQHHQAPPSPSPAFRKLLFLP